MADAVPRPALAPAGLGKTTLLGDAAKHAPPILGERIPHAPWSAELLFKALHRETYNPP